MCYGTSFRTLSCFFFFLINLVLAALIFVAVLRLCSGCVQGPTPGCSLWTSLCGDFSAEQGSRCMGSVAMA